MTMTGDDSRIPIKYRPATLADFFSGTEANSSIDVTLRTLLGIDDLNILFVGNEYCGKTTLLSILIREYYGLQPSDPIPDTDIMFVNNLKEQGISYFRSEMKTHSQSTCSIFGKKKMIIIDDIDFINEQSQQTFRNYIDKYKHNVHFISVCTNVQKVIESFQSRVYIIKLEPPTNNQLQVMFDKISRNENIRMSKEAELFLLKYCQKSFRLLINQMEKFYIMDKYITYDLCTKLCTEINIEHFEKWLDFLKRKDLRSAIAILYGLHSLGYSVIDIYDYLFNFIKSTSLLVDHEKYAIVPLFCKYITIFHTVHEDVIELSLFTNDVFRIFPIIQNQT